MLNCRHASSGRAARRTGPLCQQCAGSVRQAQYRRCWVYRGLLGQADRQSHCCGADWWRLFQTRCVRFVLEIFESFLVQYLIWHAWVDVINLVYRLSMSLSMNLLGYDETCNDLFIHHDIMLGAFPLCLEWINYDPGSPRIHIDWHAFLKILIQ